MVQSAGEDGSSVATSAIERSIRRSLEKGDRNDPDFRVMVYEAAERAIDRGRDEGRTSQEVSDRQRRDLIAAVETIEFEYPPVSSAARADRDIPEGAHAVAAAAMEPSPSPVGRAAGTSPGGEATISLSPKDAGWRPGAARLGRKRQSGSSRRAVIAAAIVAVVLVLAILAYLFF